MKTFLTLSFLFSRIKFTTTIGNGTTNSRRVLAALVLITFLSRSMKRVRKLNIFPYLHRRRRLSAARNTTTVSVDESIFISVSATAVYRGPPPTGSSINHRVQSFNRTLIS